MAAVAVVVVVVAVVVVLVMVLAVVLAWCACRPYARCTVYIHSTYSLRTVYVTVYVRKIAVYVKLKQKLYPPKPYVFVRT